MLTQPHRITSQWADVRQLETGGAGAFKCANPAEARTPWHKLGVQATFWIATCFPSPITRSWNPPFSVDLLFIPSNIRCSCNRNHSEQASKVDSTSPCATSFWTSRKLTGFPNFQPHSSSLRSKIHGQCTYIRLLAARHRTVDDTRYQSCLPPL